jgi:hypothetical protein
MLVAVLSSTHVAVGANQPAVNLGFTSFLDGVSFTPSGFVYQVYTDDFIATFIFDSFFRLRESGRVFQRSFSPSQQEWLGTPVWLEYLERRTIR